MATPLAVTYLVSRVHCADGRRRTGKGQLSSLVLAVTTYVWAMATYAALTVGADTPVYGRVFLGLAALPYLVAYSRVLAAQPPGGVYL